MKHRQASAEWCEGVNGTSVLQLREAVSGGGVRHNMHTYPEAGQLLWLQTVGGERHGVPRGSARSGAPDLRALLRLQASVARIPSLGAQGDEVLRGEKSVAI